LAVHDAWVANVYYFFALLSFLDFCDTSLTDFFDAISVFFVKSLSKVGGQIKEMHL